MSEALLSRTIHLEDYVWRLFSNDNPHAANAVFGDVDAIRWKLTVGQTIEDLQLDGLALDEVKYIPASKTLSWSVPEAYQSEAAGPISGLLTFAKDSTTCTGLFQTADGRSISVQGVVLPASDNVTIDSIAPAYEDAEVDQVDEKNSSETAEYAPPPAYHRLEVAEQYELAAAQSTETYALQAETAQQVVAVPAAIAKPIKVQVISYTTQKRTLGSSDDWDDWGNLMFEDVRGEMRNPKVFFGNKKIEFSDFMVFRDADHFVKESGRIGDPWKYAFDIQFTGEADERVFKGTVTDAAGKQMEFQGLYDTVKELDLEAMTPERIETVNKLKKLLAISSLSTQPETVPQAQNADGTTPPEQKIWPDLAQREADRIFGRLLLASLDDDVKKILFPNLVSLDAAELRIQQMAPKYLRQVALHHILGQLQSSSQVKPEIRNTIRPKKCAKFLPMCLSLAKPADKELDPVRQYGLDPDNEEQAKFVREMQDGANKVREACYLKGYRTAVSEITEFLNEPVLWYTELTDYVTRTSFMTYWCGKETSDPNGLVNLRGKLQLLYQVAMEKTGGKEKLQKPEEVITTLTAHSMQLYLKNLAFDPTSIAALLELGAQLDSAADSPATKAIKDAAKDQIMEDQDKDNGWQTLSEYTIDFLGQEKISDWADAIQGVNRAENTAAEAVAAGNAAAAEPAPGRWKKVFPAMRTLLLTAAIYRLMSVFTGQGEPMALSEKFALFGQILEGNIASSASLMGLARTAGGFLARPAGATQAFGQALLARVTPFFAEVSRKIAAFLGPRLLGWGRSIIEGTGRLILQARELVSIGSAAVGKFVAPVGQALKWVRLDQVALKAFSFLVSVTCLYVSIGEFKRAWAEGKTLPIALAMANTLLSALEVLFIVTEGVAKLVQSFATGSAVRLFAGSVVSAASTLTVVVAGLGLAIAIIGLAVMYFTYTDELAEMVKKKGGELGLLKAVDEEEDKDGKLVKVKKSG